MHSRRPDPRRANRFRGCGRAILRPASARRISASSARKENSRAAVSRAVPTNTASLFRVAAQASLILARFLQTDVRAEALASVSKSRAEAYRDARVTLLMTSLRIRGSCTRATVSASRRASCIFALKELRSVAAASRSIHVIEKLARLAAMRSLKVLRSIFPNQRVGIFTRGISATRTIRLFWRSASRRALRRFLPAASASKQRTTSLTNRFRMRA